MPRHTLARPTPHAGAGWSHPYRTGPFDPYLYADGGAGDASGSADNGTGGQASDQGGDPSGSSGQLSGSAATTVETGGGQGTDAEDLAATVKRLERELRTARSEAGKDRTAAKQQAADDAVKALTEKLGKALGLVADEAPPDPAALAKAIQEKEGVLAERDAQLRARDVELAVWARAAKAGAKADALLDSRAFMKAASGLDPTDKGFAAALDDAIKTAVKDNPSLAATPAATASGGDLSGGTGEGSTRQRPTSLHAAVRGAFGT